MVDGRPAEATSLPPSWRSPAASGTYSPSTPPSFPRMLELRDRYFLPDGPDGRPVVELRAFTHGLMPRTVPSMMDAFVTDWRRRGVDAWNDIPNRWRPSSGDRVGWWTLPTYLGDAFVAPLLGAPEGTCIMQPHVHWTVSCLLSADEPFAGGREEVVCTAAEFPSVLHAVQQWAGLRTLRPVVVPAGPDGYVDREAVLGAISDRTALVFLSHVGFTSGERLDEDFLREVAGQARHFGALFFLDGYHAGTTMPVDVLGLGCDGYFGGLLKAGSGSSGNAYLYLREGLALTPRLTGWFGDADPFGFHEAPEPHPEVRRRFLGGTTAVASLYHAVEGVRILLEVGLDAVRAHSLALSERAILRADALGLPLRSPRAPERRGAMVILEAPEADRLSAWLKGRQVFTDSRQGRFLRMAPFVWNTPAGVDRAFSAIEEALREGAYRKAEAPEEGGPVN
jgi:kynureninase